MAVYVVLADVESRFTKERVAEVFSTQAADGSTPGTADATAFLAAATDASAEFEEILGVTYVTPFVTPFDAAIVEIVAVFTMFRGARLRRPEYATGDAKTTGPYDADYRLALQRAFDLRDNKRRLTNQAIKPATVGGAQTIYLPDAVKPGYFLPNPTTGEGGFSSGTY